MPRSDAILLLVARDAYDWATLAAAALAAVGTVSAVMVALFGPAWRARRRRPRVSVELEDRSSTFLGSSGEHYEEVTAGPTLRLRNEAGKDAARDVEVAVSLEHRESPQSESVLIAEDRRLNFDDPLSGTPGVPTAGIPPAGSRRAYLVLLGRPALLAKRLSSPVDRVDRSEVGALATCPARADFAVWLAPGHYDATLVLAGSNFDAVSYRARFRLDFRKAEAREPEFFGDPEAPGKPASVEFVLTDGPERR